MNRALITVSFLSEVHSSHRTVSSVIGNGSSGVSLILFSTAVSMSILYTSCLPLDTADQTHILIVTIGSCADCFNELILSHSARN
uniref:Uncharacterized protein n=1 Tax=uncultured marine virus TaxID=186617 RepID=A0A0F7L7L6_9VIRU|nr:hypothetical protein [uncultured marine virus]